MIDLKSLISSHKEQIFEWRRDLHQIPEPGLSEKKTSAYVADKLTLMGLEVERGIAGTGVVGLLKTAEPGKTAMLRADMDALPIAEETGLPFASTHEGLMHACGHDGHMAMVLGTALIMKALPGVFTGTVKFLFQPAEEGPGGALPMIEAGVMENPRVDYSLGGHLWPSLPEGSFGIRPGVMMAAMDWFHLEIIGKGGHGAMPHLCVDPIDAAVQIVSSLQRIVSRRMNPQNPTVVTIGSIKGGTTFNIIPDSVEMSGTTRTFDRGIWLSWPERLEKILHGICEATGTSYKMNFQQGYPPLINDAGICDVARECALAAVGEDRVVEPEPTMGGEDMAYFLERSKGCFVFVGAGREGCAPLHNCRFDFNEEVLLTGIEVYCRMLLKLLG